MLSDISHSLQIRKSTTASKIVTKVARQRVARARRAATTARQQKNKKKKRARREKPPISALKRRRRLAKQKNKLPWQNNTSFLYRHYGIVSPHTEEAEEAAAIYIAAPLIPRYVVDVVMS